MKKTLLLLLIFLMFNTFYITESNAENFGPEFTDKGNFQYITIDTAASSSITWGNVGFNISLKKTNGTPLSDPKTVTIYYDGVNADHEITPYGSTQKKTVYWIKGTYLRQKIDAKYGKGYYDNTLKDGMTIYFNNIFQVYHSGREYGSKIHTLSGIRGAEPWGANTLADFKNHFDRPIPLKKVPPEQFPIKVVYRTWLNDKWVDIDGPREFGSQKEGSVGESISCKFATQKEYHGEEYRLYRSYYTLIKSTSKRYNDTTINKTTSLESVQNKSGKVLEDGVLFVALMKKKEAPKPPGEEPDEPTILEEQFMPPNPTGIIAADKRGSENFDVSLGIPTTEPQYAQVTSEEYLSGYTFEQKSETKEYPVKVSRTYTLTWTTPNPPVNGIAVPPTSHSQTVVKTTTINVPRKGRYWIIKQLELYGIKNSTLNNYSLPSESTTLSPNSYTPPTAVYTLESTHTKDPTKYNKSVTLNSITLSGGTSCPDIPDSLFEADAKQAAENAVGKLNARNDYLKFNSEILMNNNWQEEKTETPEPLPQCTTQINDDVLYKSNLIIDGHKANGIYESDGNIIYEKITTINSSKSSTLTYDIPNVPSITIHTPVVCDAQIEDMRFVNQEITPDINRNPLILDTSFNILLPTYGEHNYITGYGYRDYGKYTANREICFPFDVYLTSQNKFISKNTWTSLSDVTRFYLPIWVQEGDYTIKCRTISINAAPNNGINLSSPLANHSYTAYTATDTIEVSVSGRVYGLNLYDISDYPLWQNVFRKPNSLQLNGTKYFVGTKNQKGLSRELSNKYTFPLIQGSHPTIPTAGIINAGYVTRFSLTTIGNMHGEKDSIKITPTFTYMPANGNEPIEIDIYYDETFLNKKHKFVPIGSSLDLQNIKYIRTGDPYLSIPQSELITTSKISNIQLAKLKQTISKMGTSTNILIPTPLRTYIGTNYAPDNTIPQSVSSDLVTKSMQNWYFEFYLPSKIYAVPKGFNLEQYIKTQGGINGSESFWLKNGYIVVNFNVNTLASAKPHLSYINSENSPSGYCNMWQREGYISEKTDTNNINFTFKDGDSILYNLNKSAARDYQNRGTH